VKQEKKANQTDKGLNADINFFYALLAIAVFMVGGYSIARFFL